jgi:hypothetical protein
MMAKASPAPFGADHDDLSIPPILRRNRGAS